MQKEYKINLHLLEGCNFRCRHCFAHFGSREVLSLEAWKKIVDNSIDNFSVCEFNLAGGEPMLYKDLIPLAKYIRKRGKKVSLITNGSLMDKKWIQENASLWTTIGFSCDSFVQLNAETMGRISVDKKKFCLDALQKNCEEIKKYNPECQIKMNTVVSSLNKNEIFLGLPKEISRWKIIRIKLYEDSKFSNRDLLVSDQEFADFAERNLQMLKGKEYISCQNRLHLIRIS